MDVAPFVFSQLCGRFSFCFIVMWCSGVFLDSAVEGNATPSSFEGSPPSPQLPAFPAVFFRRSGEAIIGPSADTSDSTIFQIVPSRDNPYIHFYGVGSCREWASPSRICDAINILHRCGVCFAIHPRHLGVRVAGVSHGLPRFLCGAGFSMFVYRELGPLPDGMVVGGEAMVSMVLVFGVILPEPAGPLITLHILPAECLVDPTSPGLPPGFPLFEGLYLYPPLPVFSPIRPFGVGDRTVLARVDYGVSELELAAGERVWGGDL